MKRNRAKMAIALLILTCSASAYAQPRYDKSIAIAAAERIAQKLGDLRGGFSMGSKPEFIRLDENSYLYNRHSQRISSLKDDASAIGKAAPELEQYHSYYTPGKVRVVYAGIIFEN